MITVDESNDSRRDRDNQSERTGSDETTRLFFLRPNSVRLENFRTYLRGGHSRVLDPNLASTNETKTVIPRTVCFPRRGRDALSRSFVRSLARARTRCLNCMPPVNLGLSGIYSKAGRFFGGQELRSVQPLRAVSGNAGFPRDLPRTADWIPPPATRRRRISRENIRRRYLHARRARGTPGLSPGPRAYRSCRREKKCALFFSKQHEISSRRKHEVPIISVSKLSRIAASPVCVHRCFDRPTNVNCLDSFKVQSYEEEAYLQIFAHVYTER